MLIELVNIGMPVVRTHGRAYGHVVITKFSGMARLPHFLTHGVALRAQELRKGLTPRAYMGDEGPFQACLSPHFTSLPQPADSCIQKLQCEQNLRCRYKIL